MALVEVRPIEGPKWHKKTGKDSFTRPFSIEALVDASTGKYATGLSEADVERLEKATGYDLSSDFDMNKPHGFWSTTTAKIKLKNQTNVFNTKTPLDEIKVKVMKASKYIANSMKEFEEGLYPDALFVIHDESEEVERKASKLAERDNAIIAASKLSTSRKSEIVQILTGKSVRKQTPDYMQVALSGEIDKNPRKVLRLMKQDKARVTLHALVLEAIHKNVLRKEGASIYYMDDQLGYDLESAIDYFEDPSNQRFKAEVLEKLN